MTTMLKIEQLQKSFGGLDAVSGFNLELDARTIQGIIGPNGAGKTTVFNLITGIYPADKGRVWLDGKAITNRSADVIARAGIARTFQNIRLFAEMTVWDNIKLAFNYRTGYNAWNTIFRSPEFRRQEDRIRQESLDYLATMGLTKRRHELAKNLPYGEQRRLEIARALATNPKVLLLDEPAAGMNPKEVEQLIGLIRRIHQDFPLAILLIEHQMPLVMDLCEQVQVIDFGKTIASGNPHQVTNNPLVIQAYLGDEEAAL